eukprot:Hpha_TRINITY_DN16629_c3_g2::TRINITY_DN16629_c3_g2_i4::g.183013::m.183013
MCKAHVQGRPLSSHPYPCPALNSPLPALSHYCHRCCKRPPPLSLSGDSPRIYYGLSLPVPRHACRVWRQPRRVRGYYGGWACVRVWLSRLPPSGADSTRRTGCRSRLAGLSPGVVHASRSRPRVNEMQFSSGWCLTSYCSSPRPQHLGVTASIGICVRTTGRGRQMERQGHSDGLDALRAEVAADEAELAWEKAWRQAYKEAGGGDREVYTVKELPPEALSNLFTFLSEHGHNPLVVEMSKAAEGLRGRFLKKLPKPLVQTYISQLPSTNAPNYDEEISLIDVWNEVNNVLGHFPGELIRGEAYLRLAKSSKSVAASPMARKREPADTRNA